MADPPTFRSALAATQRGILSTAGAIEQTLARDPGWLFLKLGRIDGARLPHRGGPARQAADAHGAGAQGRPAPLPHALARAPARPVVPRELPQGARRAHGARGRAPVPALRPAHAAVRALRDHLRQGDPRAHLGGQRSLAPRAHHGQARRRPRLPGTGRARATARRSPSSTRCWASWRAATTPSRPPTSEPSARHVSRDRAPAVVRLRRVHPRVLPRAPDAAEDDGAPGAVVVRPRGGAADQGLALPRLERQYGAPLHHRELPRPHRGERPVVREHDARGTGSRRRHGRPARRRAALSAARLPRLRRAGAQ